MKTNQLFLGALKKYSKCNNIICHFKPHYLDVCITIIFTFFISVYMKFQVVLSIGGIFETVFIAELQDIPSRLRSVSLATSVYQLQMILFLLGTVNVKGEMLA